MGQELRWTVVPAGPRRHDAVATTPHLLVCIGPNCAARGSGEMFSEVWAALERDQLAYYKSAGSVRCSATGCLGACAEGPTVASYPRHGEPLWWVAMTAKATVEVALALHNQVVNEQEPPA